MGFDFVTANSVNQIQSITLELLSDGLFLVLLLKTTCILCQYRLPDLQTGVVWLLEMLQTHFLLSWQSAARTCFSFSRSSSLLCEWAGWVWVKQSLFIFYIPVFITGPSAWQRAPVPRRECFAGGFADITPTNSLGKCYLPGCRLQRDVEWLRREGNW